LEIHKCKLQNLLKNKTNEKDSKATFNGDFYFMAESIIRSSAIVKRILKR